MYFTLEITVIKYFDQVLVTICVCVTSGGVAFFSRFSRARRVTVLPPVGCVVHSSVDVFVFFQNEGEILRCESWCLLVSADTCGRMGCCVSCRYIFVHQIAGQCKVLGFRACDSHCVTAVLPQSDYTMNTWQDPPVLTQACQMSPLRVATS